MTHRSLAVAAAALTTTLVTTAGLLGSGGSAQATFPAANGRIAFAADAGQGSEIYSDPVRRVRPAPADASRRGRGPSGLEPLRSADRLRPGAQGRVQPRDGDAGRRAEPAGPDPVGVRDPAGLHPRRPAPGLRVRLRAPGRVHDAGRRPRPAPADDARVPRGGGQRPERRPRRADRHVRPAPGRRAAARPVRRRPQRRARAAAGPLRARGRGQARLGARRTAHPDHGRRGLPRRTLAERGDGPPRRLAPADAHALPGRRFGAFAGSYSPDGRWVVLRVENVAKKSYRLYKMHPDGSRHVLLARLPFSPRHIDWGPLPVS